jgi:hypothetical protein
MCVKYPLAFSFVAIVSVLTFAKLRRDAKDAEEMQKEIEKDPLFKKSVVKSGKCTTFSDLKVTPPEGVTYKWCRLYRGGESYGGGVCLDENRIKKVIGDGYYPVPYERHQDVTETLDPKKLSIQLDGFILVQDKPLVGIEDKDDSLTKVIEGEVGAYLTTKEVMDNVADHSARMNAALLSGLVEKKNILEGEVLPPEQEELNPVVEGCKQYWKECKEKNKTIDVVPEKAPDYKKMIEESIENKDAHIHIEGAHDGMQFKLDIKSE